MNTIPNGLLTQKNSIFKFRAGSCQESLDAVMSSTSKFFPGDEGCQRITYEMGKLQLEPKRRRKE